MDECKRLTAWAFSLYTWIETVSIQLIVITAIEQRGLLTGTSVTRTNHQMSIKVNDLQKLPKNVADLDKLIVAKVFEKLPKVQ